MLLLLLVTKLLYFAPFAVRRGGGSRSQTVKGDREMKLRYPPTTQMEILVAIYFAAYI